MGKKSTPVQKPKKTTRQYTDTKFPWLTVVLSAFFVLDFLLVLGIFYFSNQVRVSQTLDLFDDTITVKEYPFFENVSNLGLTARSAIVFEKNSRVVVFNKEANLRFSPASTTKIMTAITAINYYSQDQYLTVPDLSKVEGSSMGLETGEKISVKNLLYGLMLPSGNDAAYTLAYNYPGGLSGFVEKMNKNAEALRLLNTRFYDPSGYSDDNFTTAFDLARLAAHAIDIPTFKEIVETKSITVSDSSGKIVHNLENLNKLLYRTGVFGIKTGYTQEAGGVLVTSFADNGATYIIVVLKSEDRFSDTEKIIDNVISSVKLIKY